MKEKGYSARDKRVTEHEFNRKMEIETQMAEDKEREALRIRNEEARLEKNPLRSSGGVMSSGMVGNGLKKIAQQQQQGAVVRPVVPKGRRRF